MRQELHDLLCHRYQEIFRDRHGDPTETAMCWGFQCGDGWFDIIDGLCAEITRQVKAGTMPPVVAMQVKEKSGYLRFYIRDHFNRAANPQVHRLIEIAQQQAERTCQQCGRPVELTDAQRWAAMCPACAGECQPPDITAIEDRPDSTS
jgi:ferredoxin